MKSQILIILSIIIITGCTTSNHDFANHPVNNLPLCPSQFLSCGNFSSSTLLGIWTASINPETNSVTINPDRQPATHLNVTPLIPHPSIVINSYNPSTQVVDVDVTISNPSSLNAFDVRLIIYTDSANHLLLNPDDWTSLYDIPGGLIVNPFKAYAKTEANCIFAAHTNHTENLLVYLPQGNPNVTLAVDASFPGNCEEPYSIENFSQDKLYSQIGDSADISVDVLDWQDNVNGVLLYCPDITGSALLPFTKETSSKWSMEFENVSGKPSGQYTGWIIAMSSNSGSLYLYDQVTITITPGSPIPTDPEIVGSIDALPIFGDAYYVIADGDYLYIGSYYQAYNKSSLNVVDISDPLNPVVTGFVEFDILVDIAKQSDYIYVADQVMDMVVVDVSDPSNPFICGSAGYYNKAWGIAVSGNYAYVVGESNMCSYDVSDPFNPHGEDSLYNFANDIEIQDDHAFTVIQGGQFRIYDISDPADMKLISFIPGLEASFVSVDGNHAYVSGNDGFVIVDISDIMHPVTRGQLDFKPGIQTGIEVYGDHAYVAVDYDGFKIIDISNKDTPVVVGSASTEYAWDIDISGNYAFLAELSDGCHVYDISDPSNPQHVTKIRDFQPTNVQIKDSYAFVQNWYDVYHVVNISNPETPEIINKYPAIGGEIRFVGDFAFIVDKPNLAIKDFSDVMNPIDLGSVNVANNIYNFEIDGNYVYLASGADGFKVVDVSNLSNPQVVATITASDARDVCVRDDYLYAADSPFGLRIYDISDPVNPQPVGEISIMGADDLDLIGNYAYVLEMWDAIKIVDISDPENPAVVKEYSSMRFFKDIEIEGNYVYLASNPLDVLDASDPLNPVLMSYIENGFNAEHLDISGNVICATNSEKGMLVIEF
jgi:hypothetical protein